MFWIFWILLIEFSYIKAHSKINHCITETEHNLICEKHLPKHYDDFIDIKVVEFRNVQQESIDLKTLQEKFPNIENVTIYGGTVNKIILPDQGNNIKVLQLIQIGVENIGNKFLSNFPNLEILNLQGNYLQSLSINVTMLKLKSLYLGGNKWNCSMDLDWVLMLNQSIVKDLHNLTCFGGPHSEKPLLTIARFTKDIKSQCPSYCFCSMPKVVKKDMGSTELEPRFEVNCSHRGLTELPLNLPRNTKIIHLEGNEIENLTPLRTDPVYRHSLEIFLDNNKVNTIEELEGSFWLKHFNKFSLSGNKLTEIPTYAIDNALTQNINMPNAVRISLGGNPWRCDCVFTPVFQEMLQKFTAQIQDIREIKCSYVEGDENSLLPIIELSRSSVCRSPSEYSVRALDLLNGVLASLILLILGKLAYDYYYFKKTGRLPWIVTKMP